MSLERIYDLAFEINQDGSIELEQGFTEVNRVTLHACHVRYLFERSGHLLPPTPPDETAKRLAGHLFDLRETLTESPDFSEICQHEAVAFLYALLDGFCEAQPANLRPRIVKTGSQSIDASSSETIDFQLIPSEGKS